MYSVVYGVSIMDSKRGFSAFALRSGRFLCDLHRQGIKGKALEQFNIRQQQNLGKELEQFVWHQVAI